MQMYWRRAAPMMVVDRNFRHSGLLIVNSNHLKSNGRITFLPDYYPNSKAANICEVLRCVKALYHLILDRYRYLGVAERRVEIARP